MPKFSVIITNFNYAAFVGEAIQSVLNQSFQDFELIVVDDGSQDDSLERIHDYGSSNLRVIGKPNGGQASAFNAGFEKSNGEIVCFLDSDDWWSLNKLEVVDSWDNSFSREYSVLQHQLMVSDGKGETPYKNVLPSGDCFAEMRATGNIDFFVPTSGIVIPMKICERIFPIPEQLRICADAYLTRTAFVFGDVVSIPKSLGYYRKHSNLVYKNTRFDHGEYFESTLFPALNDFYLANHIDCDRFSAGRSGRKPGRLSRVRALARRFRKRLL